MNDRSSQQLSVKRGRLNIYVGWRIVLSNNGKLPPIAQPQSGTRKQGAANHVIARCRIDWIEAERGKDVPRRHLPAIVVAVQTAWIIGILLARDLAHLLLRLPGLATKVIEISDVVAWLIGVLVVTSLEIGIEAIIEILAAPHQLDQAGNIVQNIPGVNPRSAFGPSRGWACP